VQSRQSWIMINIPFFDHAERNTHGNLSDVSRIYQMFHAWSDIISNLMNVQTGSIIDVGVIDN